MFSFKALPFVCLAIIFFGWCNAKIYNKCEFAKEMHRNGVTSRADLGTWTCIAYHESRFNTKAVNSQTGDYGILQISHYWWCSDSNTPGKDCHITCKSLLGDDITEDIVCARHIFFVTQKEHRSGFTAWTTYNAYCTGDQTNWISGCNFDDEF